MRETAQGSTSQTQPGSEPTSLFTDPAGSREIRVPPRESGAESSCIWTSVKGLRAKWSELRSAQTKLHERNGLEPSAQKLRVASSSRSTHCPRGLFYVVNSTDLNKNVGAEEELDNLVINEFPKRLCSLSHTHSRPPPQLFRARSCLTCA